MYNKIIDRLNKILVIILITVFQISCSSNIDTNSLSNLNSTLESKNSNSVKQTFTEFQDIPIPENSTMNVDKTLLLGEKQNWIGRLYLNSPFQPEKVFNFFKLNLTKFEWEEITSVRSTISVLTYSLNERIMTIQIAPVSYSTKNASTIDIVMSPKIINKNL